MKRIGFIFILTLFVFYPGFSQAGTSTDTGILIHGIVRDAVTLTPLGNSQIIINRSLNSLSDRDGAFYFRVNKKDTIIISQLGYKSMVFYIGDTLQTGREYAAGIFLKTDTVSIDEVIIIPRLANLKYDILNTPVSSTPEIENARYNIAISAYQGRISQGKLGDPSSNYNVIHQKQRIDAYEKGGIPSDRMVGLSPFMILPAAYLLIHGLPPTPAPMKSPLSKKEIDDINKKYLESVNRKK